MPEADQHSLTYLARRSRRWPGRRDLRTTVARTGVAHYWDPPAREAMHRTEAESAARIDEQERLGGEWLIVPSVDMGHLASPSLSQSGGEPSKPSVPVVSLAKRARRECIPFALSSGLARLVVLRTSRERGDTCLFETLGPVHVTRPAAGRRRVCGGRGPPRVRRPLSSRR